MVGDEQVLGQLRIAVDAIVLHEGRLLLLTYYDAHIGLHLGLPGGGVETDETIHAAVRREVYEETGVQVDVGALLMVTEHVSADDPNHGGSEHEVRLLFRCTPCNGVEPVRPAQPDPDQTGVCWLALEEVTQAAFAPHNGALLLELLARPSVYDCFHTQI
ncbi:MAG: hypothetical protein DCC55_12980 [Chloroflexi bacterium]|nr:MAG: hypothetical protein DCC55_12980 [Chloroflexota bacterium]